MGIDGALAKFLRGIWHPAPVPDTRVLVLVPTLHELQCFYYMCHNAHFKPAERPVPGSL
jgi:hypothetical protein